MHNTPHVPPRSWQRSRGQQSGMPPAQQLLAFDAAVKSTSGGLAWRGDHLPDPEERSAEKGMYPCCGSRIAIRWSITPGDGRNLVRGSGTGEPSIQNSQIADDIGCQSSSRVRRPERESQPTAMISFRAVTSITAVSENQPVKYACIGGPGSSIGTRTSKSGLRAPGCLVQASNANCTK